MTTSIIIPVYNQLRYTKECWEALCKNTPEKFAALFIDNGSTDDTPVWLRERLHSIHNTTNRGYAAACNQGIRASRGDYICLLNNDTVVSPGWLAGLRACLDSSPRIGIVGPQQKGHEAREGWVHMPRLPGYCWLMRRALVERVGMLDEQFWPGNFEDDDYCRRVELAGHQNMMAGEVLVKHYGARSFEGMDYEKIMAKNRALYEQKWAGR